MDTDRERLNSRIRKFFTKEGLSEPFRTQYRVEDSSSYPLISRRNRAKFDAKHIRECVYRPFDRYFVYYDPDLISRATYNVGRHMVAARNIALCAMRQVVLEQPSYSQFLCTRLLVNDRAFLSIRGRANLFPLYLYPENDLELEQQSLFSDKQTPKVHGRRINLTKDFVNALNMRLKLHFTGDGTGDLQKTYGPEDAFHYMYAVFHCPTYRRRYAEFLKIDFPRLPLTSNVELFRKLCGLGKELVALHLLESSALNKPITKFKGKGDNVVAKGHPKYQDGSILINSSQCFEGVPEDVWGFHIGGYQVCEKWLKDRRGRELSAEDISHYQKIVVALKETIRLMKEIDEVIGVHGGWPIK